MIGIPRRFAIAVAWFWVLCPPPGAPPVLAQSPADLARDPAVAPASLARRPERVPVSPRSRGGPAAREETAAGWWLGPVGIAAALAAVGGLSLAAKRFRWDLGLGFGLGTARDLGSIGVVGQARLSPKHAVYLVRVGGRVLIVGAGPAGSPTTLGEVTDPAELGRLMPGRGRGGRPGAGAPGAGVGMARSTGFDRRIGDDE